MIQRIAQLFGVVFLLVGICGFIFGGMSMDADPATATKLFGLFPINALHNVVHMLFGVWGLLASRTASASLSFARIGGAIYVVLAVLGLVTPTTFGLIPIGGYDVYLHAVLGIALVLAAMQANKVAATTTG